MKQSKCWACIWASPLHFIIWKNPAISNISDSEYSIHVTENLCGEGEGGGGRGGGGGGPTKLSTAEASECTATKTSVKTKAEVLWQPALHDRLYCIPASAEHQHCATHP